MFLRSINTHNTMETQDQMFVPLPFAGSGCVVCDQIDAKVTLMTPESRHILTRRIQVLVEDIRRMEARLAEDKPLFAHQNCLKPTKLSLSSAIHGLALSR